MYNALVTKAIGGEDLGPELVPSNGHSQLIPQSSSRYSVVRAAGCAKNVLRGSWNPGSELGRVWFAVPRVLAVQHPLISPSNQIKPYQVVVLSVRHRPGTKHQLLPY